MPRQSKQVIPTIRSPELEFSLVKQIDAGDNRCRAQTVRDTGGEPLVQFKGTSNPYLKHQRNGLLRSVQHMRSKGQRNLGFKPGTGGSADVGWLRSVVDHRFFPELWSMRTKLQGPAIQSTRNIQAPTETEPAFTSATALSHAACLAARSTSEPKSVFSTTTDLTLVTPTDRSHASINGR